MTEAELIVERERVILEWLRGVLYRMQEANRRNEGEPANSDDAIAEAQKNVDVQAINVQIAELKLKGTT